MILIKIVPQFCTASEIRRRIHLDLNWTDSGSQTSFTRGVAVGDATSGYDEK